MLEIMIILIDLIGDAIENDLNAIKLLSHMNAHRNKFNALPNVAV